MVDSTPTTKKPRLPPRFGRGYARGCETVNLTHGYSAPALRVTRLAHSGTAGGYGPAWYAGLSGAMRHPGNRL